MRRRLAHGSSCLSVRGAAILTLTCEKKKDTCFDTFAENSSHFLLFALNLLLRHNIQYGMYDNVLIEAITT